MSAFQQLHPELQRALVQGAGWRELRPIQELSIPAVGSGANCLILAPTAGGKTEAALIPTLQALLTRRKPGLRALYLCPLKALLNNQLPRLERWTGWVGMRAFLWHGDVGATARGQFLRDPSEILMTTPESLEVLLSAAGARGRGDLWSSLELVIVDEIHAFVGEERGDHLACLLERLGGDPQRIGLSATVGNPETLLQWLCGSSKRPAQLVDPGRKPGKKRIEVHAWAEEAHQALMISRLTASGKSLVFVDSRRKAESLAASLGPSCFLHHASLSAEARERTEKAFACSPQASIVCTSTMELGLDVGDLDRVVQLGAPSTVSSLMQRLGRSGRRGGPAHMAFVTDDHWSFLQTCALLTLALRGYVEPLLPGRRSLAIFAQQSLARVLAAGGAAEAELLRQAAFPFSEITAGERRAILDHLCQAGLLARADGRLVWGEESERKLGANFVELYSVFASSHTYAVVSTSGRPVGQLDAWFAWSLRAQTNASFALGGTHWCLVEIDPARGVVTVEEAGAGALPQWHGPPRLLSETLCQAMREVLTGGEPLPFLAPAEARLLEQLREGWAVRLEQAPVNMELRAQGSRCYTFAGGRINQTLALLWEQVHGVKPSFNNLYLNFADDFVDLESIMAALRSPEPLQLSALLPELQLGKFQRFLPPGLERAYRAQRLLDVEGARRLAAVAWSVVEPAAF